MKTSLLLACAVLTTVTAPAANLRWLGVDINSASQSPGNPIKVDHLAYAVGSTGATGSGSVGSLASLPFGDGPNMTALNDSLSTVSGTSSALTAWSINPAADTLTLSLNHAVSGSANSANFTGAEGVIYFYALAEGALSITYDYGNEQTEDPTAPYKASERGKSRMKIGNNARGLGEEAGGLGEMVNRDGSRTQIYNIGPSDDLIALQFDFAIDGSDPLFPNGISDGYLNLNFIPVPEPTTGVLAALGGLVWCWRRRIQESKRN